MGRKREDERRLPQTAQLASHEAVRGKMQDAVVLKRHRHEPVLRRRLAHDNAVIGGPKAVRNSSQLAGCLRQRAKRLKERQVGRTAAATVKCRKRHGRFRGTARAIGSRGRAAKRRVADAEIGLYRDARGGKFAQ